MRLYQAVTADEYEFDLASAPTQIALAKILKVDVELVRKALRKNISINTPYSWNLGHKAVYIRKIEIQK